MGGHKAAFERVVACWPSLSLLLHSITPHFFVPLQQGLWTKPTVWGGAIKPKNGEGIVKTAVCQRISFSICYHI